MKRRDCKQAITKLDGCSTAKPNTGRYSIRISFAPSGPAAAAFRNGKRSHRDVI